MKEARDKKDKSDNDSECSSRTSSARGPRGALMSPRPPKSSPYEMPVYDYSVSQVTPRKADKKQSKKDNKDKKDRKQLCKKLEDETGDTRPKSTSGHSDSVSSSRKGSRVSESDLPPENESENRRRAKTPREQTDTRSKSAKKGGRTPRATDTVTKPTTKTKKSDADKKQNDNETERRSDDEHDDQRSVKSSRSQREEDAASRCDSRSGEHDTDGTKSEEGKAKTKTSREARAVSKLVQRKLEEYINVERREKRFDPMGAMRVSKKMIDLDLEYQLIVNSKIDRAKSKKEDEDKKDAKKGKKSTITPKRTECSNQVTPRKEVERLSSFANEVYTSHPIEKLNVIHRYRPHSKNLEEAPDNGKVHNYTRHVGSVLHGENYVQYYVSQGLHSGNKETSSRLQQLKPREEENEDEEQQPSKNKSDDDKKNEKEEGKGTSRKNSIQKQDDDASQKGNANKENKDQEDNYSDDFEPDSQSLNKETQSQKEKEDAYSDDFEPDAQSVQRAESPNPSREYDDDFESPSTSPKPDEDPDTKSMRTISSENDAGPQRESGSQRKKSDAQSVRTYISVEHAVQM